MNRQLDHALSLKKKMEEGIDHTNLRQMIRVVRSAGVRRKDIEMKRKI